MNFLEIARGQPNVGAAFGARWLCESRPTCFIVSLETLSASGRNRYLPAVPCCLATPLTVKAATFNRRPSARLGRSYQSKVTLYAPEGYQIGFRPRSGKQVTEASFSISSKASRRDGRRSWLWPA